MSSRTVRSITGHSRIDGIVPGVRGQRSLPTRDLGVVDPFVMLDHIGPETLPADFYVDGHMHPHRGFETLTIMFEGTMFHVDTAGYRETLSTGSTQNMVAGSGIQHGGDMAADPDTHVFHEVQLWVNMPAATKMQPPAITSAHAGDKPIIDHGSHRIEVITGTIDGHTSPLTTTQPTTVARIQTTSAGPITIADIPASWNAALYVLHGDVAVAGTSASSFDTVLFNNDSDIIEFAATGQGSDLLLIAGLPIGEPVAMGGPFVMNTDEEIRQAEADFAVGKFDNVTLAEPRAADEPLGRLDNSRKSILARACDPTMAHHAAAAISSLVGNPEYVATTSDDDFIEKLHSRQWSVVFFAPGACRYNAANQAIPGANAKTQGWALEEYRNLVDQTQDNQAQIVESQDESETIGRLAAALAGARDTNLN